MFFKGQIISIDIIAHNYILCAIIGGIVGIIENTILLYFIHRAFTEHLMFLLDANIKQILINS